MEITEKTSITVEVVVNAPKQKVWEFWTEPKHITQWTHASDDWHAPYADNDMKVNGKFKTTMAEEGHRQKPLQLLYFNESSLF